MFTAQFSLFGIFLILILGAVIAFAYLVVKPSQIRWAIRTARKIAANGKATNGWQFENAFRILANAHNDLEAVHLWHKLLEIREKTE